MTGTELIAQERQRQMEQEGYDTEHDDAHTCIELARAALCYLANAVGDSNMVISHHYPWGTANDFYCKHHDYQSDLMRAGALIAAEIDRMQRINGDS